MKENKNIFKEKLGSFEVNDIQDDWNETEIQLHKMRFYKFSFSNFNIYYCGTLLLALVLSSTIFVKVFFFTDEIRSVNNSAVNNIETPLEKTEAEKLLKEKNSTSNLKSNHDEFNIVNNHQSTQETNRKSRKSQSPAALGGSNTSDAGKVPGNNAQADNKTSGNSATVNELTSNKVSSIDEVKDKNSSTSTSNEHSENHSPGHGLTNTVNDNLNITPPKKNVVYITKQDTIEIYDTLRRKKPFRKSLKN